MPTPEEAIEAYRIQPDSENDPMLVYCAESGEQALVVLAMPGPGEIGGMLRGFLPSLVTQMGPPAWITFCSEAYMKSFDKAVTSPRPGELQEAAEAGDDSIQECVIANGFSKDKEFSASQAFSRVGGEVIWGDLQVMPTEAQEVTFSGNVPDAIRPLFA
jgi:hypothetical protein